MITSTPAREVTMEPVDDDKAEEMLEASIAQFGMQKPNEFIGLDEHVPPKK